MSWAMELVVGVSTWYISDWHTGARWNAITGLKIAKVLFGDAIAQLYCRAKVRHEDTRFK